MKLNLDAGFESFQERLRSGQLRTPELNQANRRRFGLPQLVVREAVAADHIVAVDEAEWTKRVIERRQERLA